MKTLATTLGALAFAALMLAVWTTGHTWQYVITAVVLALVAVALAGNATTSKGGRQ